MAGSRFGDCGEGETIRACVFSNFTSTNASLATYFQVQNKTGKKLADFKVGLEDPEFKKDLEGLKNEVEEFAETYYMPGQELQEES